LCPLAAPDGASRGRSMAGKHGRRVRVSQPLRHARIGPCHARIGSCHARIGPCHARFGPCHARIGPCHARIGPCHAPPRLRHAPRPPRHVTHRPRRAPLRSGRRRRRTSMRLRRAERRRGPGNTGGPPTGPSAHPARRGGHRLRHRRSGRPEPVAPAQEEGGASRVERAASLRFVEADPAISRSRRRAGRAGRRCPRARRR